MSRPERAVAAFCTGVLLSTSALAQSVERTSETDTRAWDMYFGDHPLGDGPWGLHFDGQLRMEGAFARRNQLLLRPGVNYDVSENVQLSGGYAYIDTSGPEDSPSGFDVPENRFWEQLILKQRLGSTRLVHRYRLEQRFVGNIRENDAGEGELVDYTYLNRFRYFLKGVVPLGADLRYFAAFYNELMIGFGDNVRNNIFDQNRSYAAFGFRFGTDTRLEIGYLLQIVQHPTGARLDYNHTFQIAFFSSRRLD